ncbi:MAG: hypothetical protein ACXU86_13910 [Archangium sp.]
MRHLVGVATAVVLALGATGCAHHQPVSPAGIEQWNANHPEASRELCVWVSGHPDAARRLFDWEAHHPDGAHEFVSWAITHPGEGIGAFVSAHPHWSDFDFITETHRPAANAFIAWCRRHPRAAEALMNHPGGLEWAARHGGC